MEKNDLTFIREDGVFNYRVGAIIMHNGSILMVTDNKSDYLYSVGGRVKMNETAEQAVMRECFEETGRHFMIDRLGFVHEKFFTDKVYGNKTVHEVSMYYYMKPLENDTDYNLICNSINENAEKEKLVWVELDKMNELCLYPTFFKTQLSDSRQIQYICERQ